MCKHTFHHDPNCGHIVNFKIETCPAFTCALRATEAKAEKAPGSNNNNNLPAYCPAPTYHHDLVSAAQPSLCLECESEWLEMTKAEATGPQARAYIAVQDKALRKATGTIKESKSMKGTNGLGRFMEDEDEEPGYVSLEAVGSPMKIGMTLSSPRIQALEEHCDDNAARLGSGLSGSKFITPDVDNDDIAAAVKDDAHDPYEDDLFGFEYDSDCSSINSDGDFEYLNRDDDVEDDADGEGKDDNRSISGPIFDPISLPKPDITDCVLATSDYFTKPNNTVESEDEDEEDIEFLALSHNPKRTYIGYDSDSNSNGNPSSDSNSTFDSDSDSDTEDLELCSSTSRLLSSEQEQRKIEVMRRDAVPPITHFLARAFQIQSPLIPNAVTRNNYSVLGRS